MGPSSAEHAVPLTGGRITPGVVRVGGTVRRPTGPNSPFVHRLLEHLEDVNFPAGPRFMGIDEHGREILSYLEGDVPDNIAPDFTDEQLVAAARLLRRYHDATWRWELAAGKDVVCHNDISPVNTVLIEERPVALIDFDLAAPGPRIRDVSYGAFLWLDLGTPERDLTDQHRRIRLWCDAYGLRDQDELIPNMKLRMIETVARLRRDGAEGAARWWETQLEWVQLYERDLSP